MGGDPAADRVRGLDARRDLGVGHHGGLGGRGVRAGVARDVELDRIDALAQAEPRHATHFVGPVDGNAETVLVQVKLAAIAQAAGHGEFRAGGQQARPVDHALIDGVAHRDVEPDLGGRRRTGAGEACAQQFARGVHGEQRMVLGRQLAQRRAARRIDEGQMSVAFDHPGIRNLPAASIRSAPSAAKVSDCGAIAAIRSPSISTLPGKGGAPVPFHTVAPSISKRIVSSVFSFLASIIAAFAAFLCAGLRNSVARRRRGA